MLEQRGFWEPKVRRSGVRGLRCLRAEISATSLKIYIINEANSLSAYSPSPRVQVCVLLQVCTGWIRRSGVTQPRVVCSEGNKTKFMHVKTASSSTFTQWLPTSPEELFLEILVAPDADVRASPVQLHLQPLPSNVCSCVNLLFPFHDVIAHSRTLSRAQVHAHLYTNRMLEYVQEPRKRYVVQYMYTHISVCSFNMCVCVTDRYVCHI